MHHGTNFSPPFPTPINASFDPERRSDFSLLAQTNLSTRPMVCEISANRGVRRRAPACPMSIVVIVISLHKNPIIPHLFIAHLYAQPTPTPLRAQRCCECCCWPSSYQLGTGNGGSPCFNCYRNCN